jgi:hypothetical protein
VPLTFAKSHVWTEKNRSSHGCSSLLEAAVAASHAAKAEAVVPGVMPKKAERMARGVRPSAKAEGQVRPQQAAPEALRANPHFPPVAKKARSVWAAATPGAPEAVAASAAVAAAMDLPLAVAAAART